MSFAGGGSGEFIKNLKAEPYTPNPVYAADDLVPPAKIRPGDLGLTAEQAELYNRAAPEIKRSMWQQIKAGKGAEFIRRHAPKVKAAS